MIKVLWSSRLGPERVQNLADQRVGAVDKAGISSPRPQRLGFV